MALPDARPILSGIADALGPALKSFFATAAAMTLLAFALVPVSYAIAADESVLRGALAVLATLIACGLFGFTVSWKRALGSGVLAALRQHRVGSALVHMLFERIPRLAAETDVGARGGQVIQAVQRLPLNEAAAKLRMAIVHQVHAAPDGGGFQGFLRRKIEARLLGYLEVITLARFRDEASANGGIDLLKVRDQLAVSADAMIIERIEGALLKLTIMLVAAALLVSVGAAFAINQIPV